MRRMLVAAAAVMMLPVIATLADRAGDNPGYKSFQLVFHSDTRGYYRPCG